MKILVPVKWVVDSNVRVRVKSDGTGVDIANVKMKVNPLDEIAVEGAVVATEIIAVSCGVTQYQENLRTAMAIGVHRSRHLRPDSAPGGHEGLQGHRRNQQGRRRPHLLGGGLRPRGRPLHGRSGAGIRPLATKEPT
jgi:hypothetical protein